MQSIQRGFHGSLLAAGLARFPSFPEFAICFQRGTDACFGYRKEATNNGRKHRLGKSSRQDPEPPAPSLAQLHSLKSCLTRWIQTTRIQTIPTKMLRLCNPSRRYYNSYHGRGINSDRIVAPEIRESVWEGECRTAAHDYGCQDLVVVRRRW